MSCQVVALHLTCTAAPPAAGFPSPAGAPALLAARQCTLFKHSPLDFFFQMFYVNVCCVSERSYCVLLQICCVCACGGTFFVFAFSRKRFVVFTLSVLVENRQRRASKESAGSWASIASVETFKK